MPKSTKKKQIKPRGSPGTLVFTGERRVDTVRVDVIEYSETALNEQSNVSVNQCGKLAKAPGVTWINVNGIHDMDLIEGLGKCLDLHSLTLEDIVNISQRPKTEEFPSYIYIVLKMVAYNEAENQVETEHVSLILGENHVVSFLEDEGDVFDGVRECLRTAKGRIRSMRADYLAYALMSAVVDHYFLAVERIGDRIEDIDDRILSDPKPEDIREVHRLKRHILSLRKAVWPLREELGALEKSASALIRTETKVFLRDLYDHTIQVIDMVETFRDILGGMHDTYLSSISNRMNEIMKVLTIIATIFIPLTFIVGVYGMNFEHMPELKWTWGYFMIWGVMLAVGIGMISYFKRKKWM
ncbi:MAG: magnesium and cobalt transport protein CorA [Desulfobacteraceae bacterium]|nr:MAG: magnesium and cobalt transport protein CorA [Desulfobacteraceae bacterium]